MNFYISDTHFGHKNILKFDNRPFETIEEMEDKMVENWNSVVGKDDMTYILGDFIWSTNEEKQVRIIDRLNGKKTLILGNHDKVTNSACDKFVSMSSYMEIYDEGRTVIMCHYPIPFYKRGYDDSFCMLCGHVHTTRENELLEELRAKMREEKIDVSRSFANIINVGCMMPYMGYTPRTLDELTADVFGA